MCELKEGAQWRVVALVDNELVGDVPTNAEPVLDVVTAQIPGPDARFPVFQKNQDLAQCLFPRGFARKWRRRVRPYLPLLAHDPVSLTNYSMVIQREIPRGLTSCTGSGKKGRRMADISRTVEYFHAIDWNFPNSSSTPGVHPYPARFIPEIPAAALRLMDPQGSVLDPFCGSGTTLVEALRHGLPAVGGGPESDRLPDSAG